MRKIGIDVGSTYTKYCILNPDGDIESLYAEKTPIRQKTYFDQKIKDFRMKYGDAIEVVSCGYGKSNVEGIQQINELTALARGAHYIYPEESYILDIGGQDTKIIRQQNGKLKEFFVNDKCAAGSGMFLANVCNMLSVPLKDIYIEPDISIKLSSVCAVFAQSEIVDLISNNYKEQEIISAVVAQIFRQSKKMLEKIECEELLLSGGLTQIKGVECLAEKILNKKCKVSEKSNCISAIGCALLN